MKDKGVNSVMSVVLRKREPPKCQLSSHVWTPKKYKIKHFLKRKKKKKTSTITALLFHTASLHPILNYASPNHSYNRERLQLCLSQKGQVEMELIMHMTDEGEPRDEKGAFPLPHASSLSLLIRPLLNKYFLSLLCVHGVGWAPQDTRMN